MFIQTAYIYTQCDSVYIDNVFYSINVKVKNNFSGVKRVKVIFRMI